MDVKPVSSKRCLFLKRKTGYLMTAYFLLVFRSIVDTQAFYSCITNESVLKILEEGTTDSLDFVLLSLFMELALIMTIATISFIVVLLVGLHKDDTTLIKVYLVFSCIIIIITILVAFVFLLMPHFGMEMYPIIGVPMLLSIAKNSFSLGLFLNYWIYLPENNWLHEDA